MDQAENSIMKGSKMRPPTLIPSSPGKGLSEISESQNNSRTRLPRILPPGSKYNGSAAASAQAVLDAEPRKTLVERGGEPAQSNIGAPPKFRSSVKGTSLASARNTSIASSTSSRPQSVSSRSTSTSSFASSAGPGNRPYRYRPQTALAFSQSSSNRSKPPVSSKRPATAMDDHLDDGGGPADGKRQGMAQYSNLSTLSSQPGYQQLHNRKQRRAPIQLDSFSQSLREVSVSTALSRLRLDDSKAENPLPNTPKLSYSSSDLSMGPPCAAMRKLRHDDSSSALVLFEVPEKNLIYPKTPSHIPVLSKAEASGATPATPSRVPKSSPIKTPFLSKDSNITGFTAWDVSGRLGDMEAMYSELKHTLADTGTERRVLEEAVGHYKIRLLELESKNATLESKNVALESKNAIVDSRIAAQQVELDAARQRLLTVTAAADDDRRTQRIELDDAMRDHRRGVDQLRRDTAEEIDRLKKTHQRDMNDEMEHLDKNHREEIRELERRSNLRQEEEDRRRIQEVSEIKAQITLEQQNLDAAVGNKDRDIQNLRGHLDGVKEDLGREQALKANLQKSLTDSSATVVNLEGTVRSLRDRIQFLESGSQAQSDRFELMEHQLQDALQEAQDSKSRLVKEETLRRILFNQVQELKGNIRVMCRVRPTMPSEEVAKIMYPDIEKESKELELQGPEEKSSLGTITRKANAFTFDRVFGPSTQNEEVFGEISQLVQSALDGYNVCIFCYGQTGAGKTYTMSSADGMIPRATHMIYEKATDLQEKGWEYSMEGSFVEVYNEDIHDLLGSPRELDKVKHEIRHDDKKKQTSVTNLKTVELDSPNAVESILRRADANRSVAATKSNERSSRSHSVFILKLVGRNSATGETSEGTLNLVDLAGSERLKQSGAEGDRMKETQNINKSLSCLGDVIAALGQGKEGAHIPYRNSKLTYLLQYSLGGNSKTLMFVMISPLEAHLKETLTSLKFATKVHNTHIGTAKRSTRVRDKIADT